MQNLVYINKKADMTLGLLTSLYIMSLLTNLTIGYRYLTLWHLNEAGGIFIFPLSFIISDILAEVYDSRYAKRLVLYGVLCEIIFSLYIFFVIKMPYPSFEHNHLLYSAIMGSYLRFTIASSGAIIIGSWLNIYFLSKWSKLVEDKYFVLRSLGSSFIGELFITVSSMLIANLGKMSFQQLSYMMFCCFFLKTLISFFLVWPAAIIVCILKNNVKEKTTFREYLNKMISSLTQFSKLAFRLDKINVDNNTINIYCRGTRVTITQKISEIIFNLNIIYNMPSQQTSYIGYYYGYLGYTSNVAHELLLAPKKKKSFILRFNKAKYMILSTFRNGNIEYKNIYTDEIHIKHPSEIYRNESVIANFESSQACYIGILAGIYQRKSEQDWGNSHRLKLVINNQSDTGYNYV
ncbi:MAG: queuosine precursor transporter [Gammaproteobacteria bacterium]